MVEIALTYPTPDGSQTISIENGHISFGRGSEADCRFDDDGLSRLHATIYREGDRVWVVDENSTNGTFVNGENAAAAGTPLKNGDTIKIGHRTQMTVRVAERSAAATTSAPVGSPANIVAASRPAGSQPFNWIPVAVIAGALFIISISVVFIVVSAVGVGQPDIVRTQDPDNSDVVNDDKPTPRPSQEPSKPGNSSVDNTDPTNVSIDSNSGKTDLPPLPSGKKYLDMSDTERRAYLEVKAMRIAQVIGNSSSDKIPPAAIDKIKSFVDAYAKRAGVKPLGGCRFGDNLQVTYERASKNAPFVIKAFNEKGIDSRIGLYLAMIESEHCVCLQSPTGPLGMFQFTKATAELHGLKVFAGASPSNPDERCQPEPAARAAASYMKALTGRYGTGPASVPLAIGSYNSGEGGLSSNLEKALSSGQGLPRDFWTLIEKGDMLSKQFQAENFKYVPKFFAAAIIGENPQDFGLNLQPISTYSK